MSRAFFDHREYIGTSSHRVYWSICDPHSMCPMCFYMIYVVHPPITNPLQTILFPSIAATHSSCPHCRHLNPDDGINSSVKPQCKQAYIPSVAIRALQFSSSCGRMG